MSLDRMLSAWTELVDETLPELEERVADIVAEAADGPAAPAVRNLSLTVLPPVLVAPARAGQVLAPLGAVVDRAVAEQDARVPRATPISFALVALVDLVNALDCAGVVTAPATTAAIRGWLSGLDVSRDSDRVARYWTVGLAALALDDQATRARIAGPAVPLQAGATFEYNLQGFIAHLAAAVDAGAALADVTPAWLELLDNYDSMSAAHMVDEGTLLWAGRVVHHRIGGAPLGEVARRVHDDLWRER